MDFLQTLSPAVGALLIFFLRLINYTMDTLRIMLTMRDKKLLSWVLGFFESILFVVVMGAVLNDLDDVMKIAAYAGGFATGNVVGMLIEKRLAIGYSHISIISREHNVNMRSISFDSNDGIFEGKVMAYVHDADHLRSLMDKLRRVPSLNMVERVDS